MLSPQQKEKFPTLVAHLESGWRASDCVPDELARLWGSALETESEIEERVTNGLFFRLNLENLRMAGMGQIPCLIVGGEHAEASRILDRFWQMVAAEPRIPCVLCMSDAAFAEAVSCLPTNIILILAPHQVQEIAKQPSSLDMFRRAVRRTIPPLRLIPYTVSQPAVGGMFFGRKQECEILLYQRRDHIVVAGPRRAGKTSLLHEFKRSAASVRGRRFVEYVDCSEFISISAALKDILVRLHSGTGSLVESYRSPRFDELGRSLRAFRQRHSVSLELILDEVDDLYEMDALAGFPFFNALRVAASGELVRVVLGGRQVALRSCDDVKFPFQGRFRTVRLGPLDEASARDVLIKPLADLGLTYAVPDETLPHLLKMTGRLPHLLQWYGNALSTRLFRLQRTQVRLEDIQQIEADFDTATYFFGSLTRIAIPDPLERMVAIIVTQACLCKASLEFIQHLLENNGWPWYGIVGRRALGRKEGTGSRIDGTTAPSLDLSALASPRDAGHFSVSEICKKLVMQNVLVWDSHNYSLANEALYVFGQKGGLLKQLRQECETELQVLYGASFSRLPRG